MPIYEVKIMVLIFFYSCGEWANNIFLSTFVHQDSEEYFKNMKKKRNRFYLALTFFILALTVPVFYSEPQGGTRFSSEARGSYILGSGFATAEDLPPDLPAIDLPEKPSLPAEALAKAGSQTSITLLSALRAIVRDISKSVASSVPPEIKKDFIGRSSFSISSIIFSISFTFLSSIEISDPAISA